MKKVYYAPDALDDYAGELLSLGLAASTTRIYCGYLNRLKRVCEIIANERGKHSPLMVTEIDKQVITRYFSLSSGKQGNLNNMLVPVRGFLNWLVSQEEIGQSVPGKLLGNRKYRKATREPKHYIEAGEFDEMLDAPVLRHASERMAIALFLFTLARRNEVAGIRLRDIDFGKGVINIYRQKRKRWTEVAMTPELYTELVVWLSAYRDELGYDAHIFTFLEDHPDWKLIPRLVVERERGANGQLGAVIGATSLDPLQSPPHLENLIKMCLDHLGAKDTKDGKTVRHLGEGCHTIRRSGARAMLRHLSEQLGNDRALLQVSTMLDHDDPRQTLAYIGMDQEREQLNEWLRTNSMYGRPQDGKVISIRRATA